MFPKKVAAVICIYFISDLTFDVSNTFVMSFIPKLREGIFVIFIFWLA
jgi:hypothetical protein